MSLKTATVRRLLLFAMALTLFSVACCTAWADVEPTAAPVNPALADYIQSKNTPSVLGFSLGEYAGGLVPEPFVIPDVRTAELNVVQASALPSSYDLRPLNKLTPIRDQGSCGSCWSFATMGSLESSLMPTESLNFSENNLKDKSGFDFGCCSGGNRAMSTAYMARWAGPIAETDDPYNAGSCTSPAGLLPQKHVQDVIFLPNRASAVDNDALKQAVMTYGAVYTTYYHSDTYYNSTKAAYYYNGSSQANHAVCIVGWDDNYAASNFGTAPPGNGAFLIRNSWGTWWGMSGYFWMSYYDSRMGKTENAVFRAESNLNYDQIYQYDTLGWVSSTGYGSNTAWFANVFTATDSSSIAAASWYAPSPGSSYTLYVYTNPTSGPTNSSGPATSVSGTMDTAGYHTVVLPTVVPVTAGQKFSVVVKLTSPGSTYPICLERPYSGYASGATASTGQSYMSSNGTSWTDVAGYYANANVCLKAFSSSGGNPAPAPGALSVAPATGLSFSGTAGGPFSPASQGYTLTNTGQSSINWTASSTPSWVSLSSAGGSLPAGASTTVTVSINSGANSLAAGSYSGSVTFTNTTNGDGSATRSISLTINSQTPTAGALSVTPTTGLSASGAVGGPFSPSSQAYTLTNTGGSSISWTATDNQSWISLSSASGTLAAGASTTVTVSINTGANGLAAGSYSGSVSFTNTTNGAGNTSTPVTLTVTSVAPPPPSGAYQVVPATYNWIDPSGHTALYLSNDSVSAAQYLPFTFTYYGTAYNRIYVGSNGLIGFSTSGIYLSTNTTIPSTYWPNGMICPYWDNLNPGAGGSVRVGVVGSAPNRQMVISWVGVPLAYPTTTKLTFQAILCEGTNDIIFQYQDAASASTYGGGSGATVGIENQTGTQGCRFSYNTRSIYNGLAIRFTNLPTAARLGWNRLRW